MDPGDAPRSLTQAKTLGDWHPINITTLVSIHTETSFWIIDGATRRYQRTPIDGQPRTPLPSIDGALNDATWTHYRTVAIWNDGQEWRLNLIPADRPPDADGVVSSAITNVNHQ